MEYSTVVYTQSYYAKILVLRLLINKAMRTWNNKIRCTLCILIYHINPGSAHSESYERSLCAFKTHHFLYCKDISNQ
jgi:hypothetical protein